MKKTSKQKSPYTFIWSDYQPCLDIEENINSLIKFSKAGKGWNELKNVILVSRNNRINCYHSKTDLKTDKERGKKLFIKKFFSDLISQIEKAFLEHQKMFQKIRKTDFSELSNQQLFNWFNETTNRWSYMISYFRFSQAEGTYYLAKELENYVSKEEASVLMLSVKIDIMNLEQIDWQKLVKKPYSEKLILDHIYEYPWVVAIHFTYKDALETLRQRYDNDKKHSLEKDIKKEKEELKKEQDVIIKKHQEIKELVNILQEVALSRIKVKSCWAGTDFYRISIYEEVSKRTGENIYDLFKYYLIEEFKELLSRNKKLSNNIKTARDKCFVGLWKNGKAIYYEGEKAEEIAEKELKDLYKIKSQNEIKGSSANPGLVKGIIHLISCGDVEDTRKARKTFQKGEILVTQMTQPNIMDIASKARAIVTDEGGMLSHAAIISRELKIPCVVGTHFATTILKDGNLVEVDANRGIVRILKREEI